MFHVVVRTGSQGSFPHTRGVNVHAASRTFSALTFHTHDAGALRPLEIPRTFPLMHFANTYREDVTLKLVDSD